MAEGMCMTVMAGSDEVNDESNRLSIADNDEASDDGDNQTRNTQQRHGYCTRRCKILCLVVVSVIAAVIAAVLIPRYLNQKDTVTVMTNKSVNGIWGQWGYFAECSRTCGNGTQTRQRACDSPAPSNGGIPCPGELEETQNCNTNLCPVNGSWGHWSSFSKCSRTCGNGTQARHRVCDSPTASHGGIPCPGELEEEQNCNTGPCPVNGIWGQWSSFTGCSQTCGNGTQTRKRACNSPAPSHGGIPCPGELEETQNCNTGPCPVNGIWGQWSSFTGCSQTCGNGTQTRKRACNSPAPSHGGIPCPGELEDAQNCNTNTCPVNGIWGQWSTFTECSRTCGNGTQTRKRACDSPAPSHGGIPCPGELEETQNCNTNTCPARDCSGLLGTGRHSSTYTIYPYGFSGESVAVYCEYNTDGVWTVIQRRIDGSVDFSRNWTEYKDGFGNVAGEYWLGNEALHEITSNANYTLKVVLIDWAGVTKVAEYSSFHIGNESDGYRLTLGEYSGNAGNSMAYDGAQFFTADMDNDPWSAYNCAEVRGQAGWWYGRWDCGYSNLNGVYHHTPGTTDGTGIWWLHWHGWYYSLKATTMMVWKT